MRLIEWILRGIASVAIVSGFILLIWTVGCMIYEPAILVEFFEQAGRLLEWPAWAVVFTWFFMIIWGVIFGLWFFLKIPKILRKIRKI
jgi:hypothetical protein